MTVWATLQLAEVKVTELGDTMPSDTSSLVRPMLTFAVGWVSRTIVNVAVPPASVVTRPPTGATEIAPGALSSSRLVTKTSDTASPL